MKQQLKIDSYVGSCRANDWIREFIMQTMMIVIALLSAQPAPSIVVKSAEEAAKLSDTVENVQVVIPDHKDQATLAAVLKNAPHLKSLELHHPDNGVPICLDQSSAGPNGICRRRSFDAGPSDGQNLSDRNS